MESYELSDTWFRHAETIGQARLNNFLMTGSILFIACTALLSLNNDPQVGAWLCISVSALGLVLSVLWLVLGLRQLKFHLLLELQLEEELSQLPEAVQEKHVVARLHVLRKAENPLTIGQTKIKLTSLEHLASSRWFLVLVPIIFGLGYMAFIFASLHILKCIA